MRACGAAVMFGCLMGCAALVPPTGDGSRSLGGTSSGWLFAGAALPDRTEHLSRVRPGEPTRFGVTRLVHALIRAADLVEAQHRGAAPLRVGDLSSPLGGRHPRHRSHRSGRDVDVMFYVTDTLGTSIQAPARAFSRFGVAEVGGRTVFFDDARNWALVRALLTDPELAVQWVFCSRGIESRLLRHALAHEHDEELVLRAAYVLTQPRNAAPHDDHFHVRVLCSPDEELAGCVDTAPIWPWLRASRSTAAAPSLDDASLLDLLEDAAWPGTVDAL